MSLFVASLNSGSNGNCYYIGNEEEAVLIDAGLSCRETVKRMRRSGLPMQKIKAVFISHEHTDHIKGAEVLSGRYQLPVYITATTLKHSYLKIDEKLLRPFYADEPVNIGELIVHPFSKLHDASEPHSFTIEYKGIKTGVFTDLGIVCENLVKHFKECHAAFLETNYDEKMLEQGSYPVHLKNRIRGGKGHLSNKQALDLFIKHKPTFMSHLFLSHLSKENNNPELVHGLFAKNAGNTNIIVASRYEETGVYNIGATALSNRKIVSKTEQPSLF